MMMAKANNIYYYLYVLLTFASLAQSQSTENIDYRLPTVFTPINYDIDLTLPTNIFEINEFSGTVVITFIASDTSNTGQEIRLHSNGINITGVSLQLDNENITITEWPVQSDSITDILVITASTVLDSSNEYTLTIDYIGQLRTDEMYGFYRSYYQDAAGTTRYLATTQFQATHARRAFPCFDEPNFKATFNVRLTYPVGYEALSNTPIVETVINADPALETATFQQTPKMSTYLLAFIVSEFTCSDGEDIQVDVPYRVCSRNESISMRDLALDLGPSMLRELESYLGIGYNESGIEKMDQVAISDFAAGAMENWGLVTYRETALLWDAIESSNRYRQSVATVITHEFAHMWFGNLVTLSWWSDVFLNEGFARYFQYFATHNVLPLWELDKQFVIEQVHGALESDASATSPALSVESSSQSEISSRFSTISYNKGASIFRMVEHIIGSLNFQTDLNNYLNLHKSDNTVPDDLWDALNFPDILPPNVANLAEVMSTWTIMPGYPLLSVQSNGNTVTITQKRFMLSGENDTKWYVPISYTKSSDSNKFENTQVMAWLTPNEDLTIANLSSDEWIIINNQQTGFYRVNYDSNLWNRITAALLNQETLTEINVVNRAQIVDDLFNLAKVNEITYSQLLTYIRFLQNEVDYYPWYAAFTGFSYMLRRTENIAIRTAINDYITDLAQNLFAAVPFEQQDEEDQIYTLKQVLAQTWACQLGDANCTATAKEEFEAYKSTAVRPSKNLRSIIYCNALRNSEDIAIDWNFLWDQFTATQIATEQITILSALGCTTNEDILINYLSMSINSSSGIRQQDASSVFSAVYTGNQAGIDVALDFVVQNYEAVSNYYGSMNALSSLINGLSARFTNQAQLTKLQSLIINGQVSESDLSVIQNALETAAINLQWTESFENQMNNYFDLGSSANDLRYRISTGSCLVALMLAVLFYEL